MGYPASGKSSFFRKHFQPAGYVHVNQDTLRTREKCLNVAEQAVKGGKSVVIGKSKSSKFGFGSTTWAFEIGNVFGQNSF